MEDVKRKVGYEAVDKYVRSGMVVGLGTGSTAAHVVARIGEKLANGALKDIVGVPTSENTRKQAESIGIPLATVDEKSNIDVAIDGADEVDTSLQLVKGRGGALLREKLVEQNAKSFVVVVDESKCMKKGLGTSGAMPVEINTYCHKHIMDRIMKLSTTDGSTAKLRMQDNKPYVTDNNNYIVDLYFDAPIKNPILLADELIKVVGVVEHGLFLDMATVCLVGKLDGSIYEMTRNA
eukprot:GHVT01007977.1.p2 GENE.GHVT01007977.1~~GHVT01007977.1.p2  ORF type:complete len:236 (-),score=17.47 GHVT01007977.1:4968-5675(-)